MSELFWLSDEQWERIEPLLPVCKRGFRRVDDRRVISGIIHVLEAAPWRQARRNMGRGGHCIIAFVGGLKKASGKRLLPLPGSGIFLTGW